jgi:hypothetical protein
VRHAALAPAVVAAGSLRASLTGWLQKNSSKERLNPVGGKWQKRFFAVYGAPRPSLLYFNSEQVTRRAGARAERSRVFQPSFLQRAAALHGAPHCIMAPSPEIGDRGERWSPPARDLAQTETIVAASWPQSGGADAARGGGRATRTTRRRWRRAARRSSGRRSGRFISDCHFAVQLNHFISGFIS